MSQIQTVTREIAGAQVTIPVDSLFESWKKQLLGNTSKAAVAIPDVGEYWPEQGGVNAGWVRNPGHRPHLLIIPTDPAAEMEEIEYGGRGIDEPGATNEYDGLANTLALAASSTDHPAAKWAVSATIEGHSDLYVMARREALVAAGNVPHLFKPGWHGLSTQSSALNAWIQYFVGGSQYYFDGKASRFRFRLARRFIPLIIS